MNLFDAKIQNYSKVKYLHVFLSIWWPGQKKKNNNQKACFSKWTKESCTLTPWCKPWCWWLRGCLHCVWKVETQRASSTEIVSEWAATTVWGPVAAVLCSHLIILLKTGKKKKKESWEHTFFVARYILRGAFKHLPCIQNQRNPGLPCHLWIHLWSQVEHPGVARKNLGSGGAHGLHAVAWSLGHGSPLVLGCVSEGYRMSQSSSVSLRPRLASAP